MANRDLLLTVAGETIPVDGTITTGEALIDQQMKHKPSAIIISSGIAGTSAFVCLHYGRFVHGTLGQEVPESERG